MILKGGDTRLKKAASTIAAMKPNQFNNGAVGGQYFLFLIFLISPLSHLFFEHLCGCHFLLCFTVIQSIAEAILFTNQWFLNCYMCHITISLSASYILLIFFSYICIFLLNSSLSLLLSLSIYLCIYSFIYQSINLSIYFPLSLTHSPSTSLSTSFFLSLSLSLFLSFCFYISLPFPLFFCHFVCLSLPLPLIRTLLLYL